MNSKIQNQTALNEYAHDLKSSKFSYFIKLKTIQTSTNRLTSKITFKFI